ncbi:MAG: hypothetical protein JXR91_11595 [Deltaproteobacteria bacterium]|nr:hypothetical protein [Deltaproteobacteria bacterium]
MKLYKKIIPMILFAATIGAGPCSVMELDADKTESETDEDTETDTTGDCNTLDIICNHHLTVNIMIAIDTEPSTGIYSFKITAPDSSEYYIDCILNSTETGFECTNGDTEVMYASLNLIDSSIIKLDIAGAPPSALVEVFYNDYEIGKRNISPQYDISYPNGEGCEPACYTGSDYMAISLR